MDDPSQMEHLGRELADAHHEDIAEGYMAAGQGVPAQLRRSRAPNRHAYMQRR